MIARAVAALTAGVAVAALVSTAVWLQDDSQARPRSWVDVSGGIVTEPADEIAVGEQLVLRFSGGCTQLVAERRGATDCISPIGAATTVTSTVVMGGRHVVLVDHHHTRVPGGQPEVGPAASAVVWSSSSPEGRSVSVTVSPNGATQHLVWEVAAGEEPWGVQLLDRSGRLLASIGLVGLPAP